MEDLFTLIGKLYFDLVRAQSIIENLKKQLENTQQNTVVNNNE